ncbi:P-loop containing nucleoside triphosphate hydrolase protein [Mycena galopus ATCC 62051]|nr:P-loop containing nucleoside triphosphate hydrolase protein [Mycena galopus ATCC 62051]
MATKKLTIVGDYSVGKTTMLITFTMKFFPSDYVPYIIDNHLATVEVQGATHQLILWDTDGEEDYDRLRPLSYPQTDVFFVCFRVDALVSFTSGFQKSATSVPTSRSLSSRHKSI